MTIKIIEELHLKACQPGEVAIRLVLTNTHGITQAYDISYEEGIALNTFLSSDRFRSPEGRGEGGKGR